MIGFWSHLYLNLSHVPSRPRVAGITVRGRDLKVFLTKLSCSVKPEGWEHIRFDNVTNTIFYTKPPS